MCQESVNHYKEYRSKGTYNMGMAAGQARLLSITARLTDNENTGQALSYSKQRLADETEQVNATYNEALNATKLTVLTGFNGSVPNYTDVSYALMTGYNTVACGKQYVVTDAKGQILVTKELADAFEKGNGDINVFLAELGYTQSDIRIERDGSNNRLITPEIEAKIHEAWDKYYRSVGKSFYTAEHGPENPEVKFNYTDHTSSPIEYFIGYAEYTDANGDAHPLNYEGTTKEQRQLYDYAVALTEAVYSAMDSTANLKHVIQDPEHGNYINYLKNIFNEMFEHGYYVEGDPTSTINDNNWFEQQLKQGKLFLKYYSTVERDFVQTTLSEDDAIQEVEDERKIAQAESKYNQDIAALEKKDQRIDLELKKLDTEHQALQLEYDSVKNVVDKNVEKSFQTFG